MNDTELLRAVIIALAAVNSVVIARLEDGPGCCGKRRYFAAAYAGGVGCVIFVLSVIVSAAVGKYLSYGSAAGRSQILVAVLCIMTLIWLLRPLSRRLDFEKYHTLIFINSILLSTLLLQTASADVGKTALRAAIFGGYFIPGVLLFSRIRTRVDESEASPCFAGLPVMLLSGAFLSLALSGILGIAEKLFT